MSANIDPEMSALEMLGIALTGGSADDADVERLLREAEEDDARLRSLNAELLEALKSIANGPWPDEVDSPEAQCRFDDQIARAAITKAEGRS